MNSMSSCEVKEGTNETPHVLEGGGLTTAPVDGLGVMRPSDQWSQKETISHDEGRTLKVKSSTHTSFPHISFTSSSELLK